MLVNYYFFRKLDDAFRDEVTDFNALRRILSSKKFSSTPFLFIITDRKELTATEMVFDQVALHLIERFSEFFQTLEFSKTTKAKFVGIKPKS